MNKIKNFIGYSWAIICLLLTPAIFANQTGFSQLLAQLPFMKVTPKYTGGEVVRKIEYTEYTTEIHEPIFEALIGESSEGFVQVTWRVKDKLPERIKETVDFNNDNLPDFQISINTKNGKTKFIPLSEDVLSLDISSEMKKDWAIRVNIKNTNKR